MPYDTRKGHPPPVLRLEEELPTNCPADRLLRLLRGEWTVHVLWVLGESGAQRFVALRERLDGVSPKVLTERLRRMEANGLIWRDRQKGVPPRVTYGLTGSGRELHSRLKQFEKLTPPYRQ